MKLETFFEKFDELTNAPNSMAKMRGLVLELAVQGRLASALPGDGAVPSEIEFRENAAALANSLGLRSPKESVEEPEPPFDVPPHWRWMALADIGAAQTGTTPSKTDHGAFNGEIPFIKPADILPDSINYSNESLTRHGARSGSRLAPSGSLLMVCIGTIGKCNLIERECAFNQQINSLTPVASIDPRYLLVVARSHSFQDAAWKKSSSTTIAILNKGKWLSIPVPLPPLPEQKRIVAKVDELMALCDRLQVQQQELQTRHAALAEASLARFADAPTPANLNFLFHQSYTIPPANLRKSILTLAVQGKLVPQDPNDEPAEELLTGIASDISKAVRAKRMRNSKPIPAYEDEYPFDLPVGWEWAALGTLTAAENGAMCDGPFGSKLKTEHYISTKGYAVLRLGNIGVGYFIHGKEGHISREHFESLPSNHTAPGDLLVAGLADPLVRCCEVPPDLGPAVNKSDCFRVRLHRRMDRSYVRHYLNSPIAKAFAAEENHGMTRERINLANAKALLVSVPPLAEQRRIVAKVNQLMVLVDQLETQLAASRATAANLLEALVAELANQASSTLTKNDTKRPAEASGLFIQTDDDLSKAAESVQTTAVTNG